MAKATVRLVAITGMTRGLGRALAEGLARAGHTVVGCGRSAEAIAHRGVATGRPHDFAALDVTHDLAVKAWADRILAEYGPPDLWSTTPRSSTPMRRSGRSPPPSSTA